MTLDEAAKTYAKMLYPGATESNANYTNAKDAFKDGAEWQQAQEKPIIKTLESIEGAAKAALLLIKSQS